MADLHSKLDELTDLVEHAKSMPLSSSCVLSRPELLAAIDEIRQLLPTELAAASGLLRTRQEVVDAGHAEAEQIVAAAHAERARLISRTEVAREAERQAARVLEDAREAARAMRLEVEDYVDGKLANFEVVLHKTVAAVERGREKLRGRAESETLSGIDEGDPIPG